MAEFSVNSKVYISTKISPFIANYRRELWIRVDIKKKRKIEIIIEFVERMRKIQEKVEITLKRV